MGLFERKMTVDELQKRLADFDTETARLADNLDKTQRRVSGALARGEDAGKLLQIATSLRVQADSRPLAKQALERELRRLQRQDQVSDLKRAANEARSWASRITKQAEKISAALIALADSINGWRALAGELPPGAGPAGDLVNRSNFRDALGLAQLPEALKALARGKGPALAEDVVRRTVEMVRGQADQMIETKIGTVERADRQDPEPALDLAEPVQMVGG